MPGKLPHRCPGEAVRGQLFEGREGAAQQHYPHPFPSLPQLHARRTEQLQRFPQIAFQLDELAVAEGGTEGGRSRSLSSTEHVGAALGMPLDCQSQPLHDAVLELAPKALVDDG